ncbi:uncharacterized protein LOC126901567 isoform X2 [Daktulosphaira vitifoliae]|uniref:uncharacterized protein LOC126901567 isoform X1 n=1 Tax=Daktulosphaira vitifoliae TaxID=58002 RepID=UPI0021A9B5B2|nr:uncharacterized protein LOC126901567 isoform X1 [Daktulosphaira vitifoliae]XP_050534076.1 uncharacterized protein LOC126901567 isoform X2 [Daktulosphaira vitifoliae]
MAYNRMNANKRGEIGKRKLSKSLIDKLGDNYSEDVAENMIKDICSPGKRYILFMVINKCTGLHGTFIRIETNHIKLNSSINILKTLEMNDFNCLYGEHGISNCLIDKLEFFFNF